MELTEDQKRTVTHWAEQGCGLSEIQKRLAAEMGITMTYMEARFLALDMGLNIRDKEPASDTISPASSADLAAEDPPGNVTVEVDRITKPGSLVSGTVKFSDGSSAAWFLDQLGRLALDMGKPGHKPGRQDLEDFQRELKKELEKRGF
jgi:hypothetical protein